MTERIRERLKDLAAFLELQHAVENIDETLEHLQSAVAAAMVQSRAAAQQCTLLLLQSESDPPSLLAFLDASAHMSEDMRKREIAHAREKVLELLAIFLKLYGAHTAVLAKQVVALVTRCQLIARVDASNKVRASAFSVLINALKYSASRVSSEDVEPAQYVEKLFADLKYAKATQTTKGLAIETIGHLAERFPSDVAPAYAQLINWTEDALEKQFATAEPEMLVVRGLLFLLDRLLAFERDRYASQPAKRAKIYSYLSTVLATTVNGQLSRYHVTMAVLRFLAANAAMFRDEIGGASSVWFAYMKFCCTSENKTIKEHALACSDSVLTIIGDVLARNMSESDKKAFNRIAKELLPVLNTPDASSALLGFVLQSLGKLAQSTRVFLGAKGFAKIEEKLRSYGENLLALDERATATKWSIVSQYLECIAQFIRQSDATALSDGYVNFVGDLLCHIAAAYPHCVWKTKHFVYKSVLHIFDAISCHAELKLLADRFVYHTLLLTISNLTEADASITLYHPDTGAVETRLLYDYEAFWVGLMRASEVATETSDVKASLKRELLDSLVKCVLRVIVHLDLSYSYESEASSGTSSSSSSGKDFGGYKPRVARDHTIMLNLTEFFRRLVPKLAPTALAPWVPLLLQHTIQRSSELPLVSSFYHIGTVLGRVAEALTLFESTADTVSSSSSTNDVIVGLREEYELFLDRVCAQLRFYKDELLVAAAECVLSAPLLLVRIDSALPALLSTLDIGKSHLPAAEIGVTALEQWLRACPTQLDAALPDVIPVLAPYLNRSDNDSNSSSSSDEPLPAVSASQAKAAVARTRSVEDGVTELGKLQRRILVVLGSTGGKGATLISELQPSSSSSDSVGQPSVAQFTLSLELSDSSITLALDKLMAQTGDVATTSTDRRVKVAACETYHALVCYLCGKTATHPHSSERKSVFYPTWQAALPTVLVLATDAEKVCRALFEPLLFQLVRWLCSASEIYPFEYALLLDELVAGLAQARNSAVREVAGQALAAVLSASIDHAGGGASRSVARAEVVFERLFALCRHPSSLQRIGVATAINYVVRSLSADNSEIISAFALRCVRAFLHALRLCDRDDMHGRGGMAIARESIQRALGKLERAVARFPHVFIKRAAHRAAASTAETLDETAAWLFAQSMKREPSFRSTCQRVFVTFAPLVSGAGCRKWLLDYAAQGTDIAALLAPADSLARVLHATTTAGTAHADEAIEWLDQFTASIDAFAWYMELLGDRASSVLAVDGGSASSSALKRKVGDVHDDVGGDSADSSRTMAWAIRQFLNLVYPGEHAASDASTAEYAQHKRLTESYGAALVSLCSLVTRVVASSARATLSWLIDPADRAFCETLASRVVDVLADDRLAHWSVNRTHVTALHAFCRSMAAATSGSAIKEHLRVAATERLEPLVRALDAAAGRTSSSSNESRDLAAIHCASAFLTQLLECDVLDQRVARRYEQPFANAARRAIETQSFLARRDRVALAALKAALLCGWDIAHVFRDADARKHFAPIYHDIVACLPQRAIWTESASHLVGSAANDAQVLTVLADVLRTVASLHVFVVESPEWDAFTELLLPRAKRFVQSIRVNDLELQHQRIALQVLVHLVEIYDGCSPSLRDVLRLGPVPDIRDVVVAVLNRRATSYLVKADALHALARLSRGTSAAGDTRGAQLLIETLQTFMADEFPIVSTDVKVGTKEYDVFRLFFRQLLAVVEESRSVRFLSLLYTALKEMPTHLFASDLTRALTGFADKLAASTSSGSGSGRNGMSGGAAALLELADVLLDATIDSSVRKTLLTSVFTPLMELQSSVAMQQFFLTAPTATATTGASLTMLHKFATLIANATELSTTGSFFSAAVAFALVELLFRLAEPEFIRTDINSAFLGHSNGKGREFTMLVCKSASKLITKAHSDVSDNTDTETIRFACCEAYSCLLTAVSKTQKQEKFFDQILFQDALWPNVIDPTRVIELRAETGAFPTIPLSVLSAATLRAQQQTQDAKSPRATTQSRSTTSAAMQFFTNSSLSQNAASLASPIQSDDQQRTIEARSSSSAQYEHLEIELDAINEHPCMVPLLRVLVLMQHEFGANWDAARMPSWMAKLLNVVNDPLTALNVRLFIVKVVLNVPELFTPYAANWLGKMLDTALEATAASATSTPRPREFNYLLRDCCNLVLGAWRSVDLALVRSTAPSRFVSMLVELTPHATTAVLHDNILLVTRLIVMWKDAVRVDASSTIERFLFSDDHDARLEAAERIAALQIVSAMLTAGTLDALDATAPSEHGRSVLDGVALALQHKRATVYTVAAEVAGLALHSFGSSSSSTPSNLVSPFARAITDEIVKAYNSEDAGRFLALLRNVSLHEPRVIDAMMLQRLCSVLPKVVAVDAWSRFATESLEHAAASADVVRLLFPSIQPVVGRFVSHRDASVQFATLRAMDRIADVLAPSDLARLLVGTADGGIGLLSHYAAHTDANCRRLMYAIAMRFFRTSDPTAAWRDSLRRTLLGGLCDRDAGVRAELLAFWHDCELLPAATGQRLVALFGALYTPELAHEWVYYAPNLLVLLAQRATDYNAPLFASALTKSEYRDTVVDAVWEDRAHTMAPMFSVESDAFAAKLSRSRGADSDSPSNWGSLTQDPFGFATGTGNASQLVTTSFGSPQQTQAHGSSATADAANPRQRRRFAARAAPPRNSTSQSRGRATSDYFKAQYTLLHKHQQAVATRHRRARAQDVTIKRQYRVGEYPDIQIQTRDIVEPLLLLCSSHAATATTVFAGFFASIVLGSSFQDDADALLERLQQTLTAPTAAPSFVGCVHFAYFSAIVMDPTAAGTLALPASAIGNSTLASGCYHSGELILEELLNHHLQSQQSQQLSPQIDTETYEAVTEYRDQLYKVLATVQKSDLLIALAASCCTVADTRLALQARIAGDLPLAIASYKKAESVLAASDSLPHDDDNDDVAMESAKPLAGQFEALRCYWERLACLEQLNHWDKLERELLPDATSDNSDLQFLWQQEPPYLEQGLGHIVRAYVGALERKRDDPHSLETQRDKLRTFLDAVTSATSSAAALRVTDVLATRLCPELCLMHLELGDTSRVRVLVETFYATFYARWQTTSAAATLPRLELMQALASVVQLDELLVLVQTRPLRVDRNDDNADSHKRKLESAYVSSSAKWTRLQPSDGIESLSAWSRFYMLQSVVSDFVCALGSDTGVLSDAAMRAVQLDSARVMLAFGRVAVANDVLALASKYLKDYREVCNRKQLPKVSALMVDVFVSHVLKLAERQLLSSEASNELSAESIKTVTRYYEAAARMFDNDDILTVLETADARERVAIHTLEARAFGSASQFYLFASHDTATAEESFTRSIDVFERSCKTVATLSKSPQQPLDASTLAVFQSCRLAFVEFLVDVLFTNDESRSSSRWDAFSSRETLTKLLLQSVVNGMAMGDQACSNYLPQLFDAVTPYPALVSSLERELLTNVPMWTCLRWAAQLMALLNGPIGNMVVRVLEKMASEYPAALFYDFKVACGAGGAKGFKTDVTRLAALIANPVMEKFVDALRLIHHPELRLKEALREIARCLDESQPDKAAELTEALWTDCFAVERTLLGRLIGRYNREWAKRTRPHMEKLLGRNGRNVTSKAVAAAREWIANNFAVVPGRHGITKDMKARLVDFAEWLDEFDHTKSRLELPGQYGTYWGKPEPSSHVHVLSVASLLGVLASKQLPKQITLHGSDERDYTFLVKGGEDLRLDQRIEQLFDVMNQVLQADPRCRDRQLVTRTYKVIPMTPSIGIIEWLHDTATLKGLLERRLTTDARCADLASNKRQKLTLFNTTAARQYESYLLKQRGATFCAKVVAPSTVDVSINFAAVQALVPADLLRRELLDLSASVESFVAVRSAFARSLAVFSACAYVLGIGDRHLDNFLLDVRSGAVIGIDFGVSFGAGASALPVPELVPFRFTRQLAAVLAPFDAANLLAQDMTAVFSALRARKQVVESVMNVFLHEPLLDWQQSTITYERAIFAAAAGVSTSDSSNSSTTSAANDNVAIDSADRLQDTSMNPQSHGRTSRKSSAASSRSTDLLFGDSIDSADGDSTSVSASAWLPDVKIAIARRKLEGFSPRALLKEELSQNPHVRGATLHKFHALIDGVRSSGESSRSAGEQQHVALSPLAQAEELLALATSPDVLGRTYHGWMPWL